MRSPPGSDAGSIKFLIIITGSSQTKSDEFLILHALKNTMRPNMPESNHKTNKPF